jgi:hypothetical protein
MLIHLLDELADLCVVAAVNGVEERLLELDVQGVMSAP